MDEPLRLTDPGDLAAALPGVLGFRPHESLVLLALRGERGRLGMTARADLPTSSSGRLAEHLAHRMAAEDPDAVVVAVVSEAPDEAAALPGRPAGEALPGLPHRGVVHDLVVALARLGVPVRDTLLVRAGRWWSYDCPDPCCAPGAGTPLPAGISPVTVAAVAAGAVVEPDRGALAARIASAVGPEAEACAAAVRGFGRRGLGPAVRAAAVPDPEEVIERALRSCAPGSTARLSDEEVAAVVWALTDVAVRDRALALALGPYAAAAETLWTECTRRAPAPLDAAPATLLAVSAWLRGDGAMANVALERALAGEPGYRLALLLQAVLSAGVPPADLRSLISEVAAG